jgi:hypothetical protein
VWKLLAAVIRGVGTSCVRRTNSPSVENGLQTARWVLRLYKDPLSFAFHVERARTGEPVGFVFGGFALAPEPLLLLNGIYLRRQERKVRFAALDAIERTLARPLGLARIGIANCHGGRGELPEAFRQEMKRATRLRALRGTDGELETKLYDDISDTVNLPIDLELHWKDLAHRACGPRRSADSARGAAWDSTRGRKCRIHAADLVARRAVAHPSLDERAAQGGPTIRNLGIDEVCMRGETALAGGCQHAAKKRPIQRGRAVDAGYLELAPELVAAERSATQYHHGSRGDVQHVRSRKI